MIILWNNFKIFLQKNDLKKYLFYYFIKKNKNVIYHNKIYFKNFF